ncbi:MULTISPECIES: hypothetical protein [unclassified Streptomyces]|uniref:hypothetical protein n=1 Tax=unclassified Streptomyces TaxID=2593676 RepID=UPI000B204BB7|nr:hypothetical protein [Streptomyces sp. TSRI0281]
MQNQQYVVDTLASLGKVHEELTDFSGRLLREYNFGSNVELVHQVLIEPIEESVRFTSLHRLTVSVGLDFADSKEIDIAASFVIGESACTAVVAIRANLGEAVRDLIERELLLHEESVDGVELRAVIRFLETAVKNLDNLADPLKLLAQRHT